MTDHIRVTKAGGVLTLALNRPDKKNALTDAMYAALADALEAAEHSEDVRAILIRGEGDMFTAGNDISEFAAVATGGGVPGNVVRFLNALAAATKPLVAAVRGRAVGVGMTMLLHADHVLLADDAMLSAPFVNLALVPEAASSLLLPARIGHVRAFAVMALGETVDAWDAVAWGLANRVVPVTELDGTAATVAARLTRLPPGALRASKTLMRATEAIVGQMRVEMQEFGARLTSPEAQEAFRAFAERRPPDFGAVD